MEDGAKPTDIIVDAPVSFGGYSPHNYENDYKGAMTLVNAFAESRNVPAVKLAAHVGIHKVIDLAHRFGVTSDIPAYLPIALGAAEITLEQQVASYAVFPNDGIRVTPRLIRKVENYDGITLWQDRPEINEVISQQTARSMMTLLQAVTAHGTGAAVAQMKHPLGGKTGTTSDFTDAWFLGFSPSITCGVWMGFDSREPLGEKETGARAALPIWMTFMGEAIKGKDDEQFLVNMQDDSKKADATTPSGAATRPGGSTAAPTPHPAGSVPSAPPAKATRTSGRSRSRNSSSSGVSASIVTGSKLRICVSTLKPAPSNVGRLPTFVTA